MPEAVPTTAQPRPTAGAGSSIGDMTRHTQSILERAQTYADA